MLDFVILSAVILIGTFIMGIPLPMGLITVLLFGVAWCLIGDE